MDAMRVCCAGLDVHQAMVVACIIKGPLESKPKVEIREFSTVLLGLLALQDWLSEEGCTDVAMESTGVYWKPIYNVLESTCESPWAMQDILRIFRNEKRISMMLGGLPNYIAVASFVKVLLRHSRFENYVI